MQPSRLHTFQDHEIDSSIWYGTRASDLHGGSGAACGSWLDPTTLGHGSSLAIPDDEVIQDTNLDQCQGLLEASSDDTIRGTRLETSTGMVVAEHHGGGIVLQGTFGYFARMYFAAIDGSMEQFFVGNHPMPGIEKQDGEYFMTQVTKLAREVFASLVWIS